MERRTRTQLALGLFPHPKVAAFLAALPVLPPTVRAHPVL